MYNNFTFAMSLFWNSKIYIQLQNAIFEIVVIREFNKYCEGNGFKISSNSKKKPPPQKKRRKIHLRLKEKKINRDFKEESFSYRFIHTLVESVFKLDEIF